MSQSWPGCWAPRWCLRPGAADGGWGHPSILGLHSEAIIWTPEKQLSRSQRQGLPQWDPLRQQQQQQQALANRLQGVGSCLFPRPGLLAR